MLGERELSNSLMSAQAKANVCRKWCSIGIRPDGAVVETWHNGLGSSDTDHQRIHNSQRLALSEDALSAVLARWIESLHKHSKPRFDLNEGAV